MHVSFILFTEYILINFQTMFKIDTYLIDIELHFWSNSWTIVKHEGSGYMFLIHISYTCIGDTSIALFLLYVPYLDEFLSSENELESSEASSSSA